MYFIPRCLECEHEVDPNNPGVLREVTGFDRPRDGGGQNHIRFRRETGRFLCATCAVRMSATGNAMQEALL